MGPAVNVKTAIVIHCDMTRQEREYQRLQSPENKEYRKRWNAANKERVQLRARERYERLKDEREPSCPVYFLTCKVTGLLFTSRSPRALYSDVAKKAVRRQYSKTFYNKNLSSERLIIKKEMIGIGLKQCYKCKVIARVKDTTNNTGYCDACYRTLKADCRKRYKDTTNGKVALRAYKKGARERLTDSYVRKQLKGRGFFGNALYNHELIQSQRLIIKTKRLCNTSPS